MKLNECLLTAAYCGLQTVGEALTNIGIHSLSLFDHGAVETELTELMAEIIEEYGKEWNQNALIPQHYHDQAKEESDVWYKEEAERESAFGELPDSYSLL